MQLTFLEKYKTKLKNLGQNITDEGKFNKYKNAKDELENLYDKIAAGMKIRSKWDWNQYVEKLLNLEKEKAVNDTAKKIIKNNRNY